MQEETSLLIHNIYNSKITEKLKSKESTGYRNQIIVTSVIDTKNSNKKWVVDL